MTSIVGAALDGSPGLSTPRIVDVEATRVAIVRKTVTFAEMPAFQRSARASLAALSTTPDAHPLGARLTIFWPPRDGMIDYAPGVLISRACNLPDGIEAGELPKGRAAHLRLTGSYADLPGALGAPFRRLRDACVGASRAQLGDLCVERWVGWWGDGPVRAFAVSANVLKTRRQDAAAPPAPSCLTESQCPSPKVSLSNHTPRAARSRWAWCGS